MMQFFVILEVFDRDCVIKSLFRVQLLRSFFQLWFWSLMFVDGSLFSLLKSCFGIVLVEDFIIYESVVNSKVLLLYIGGVFGWKVDFLDFEGKQKNVNSYFSCFFFFGGGQVLKGSLGVVVLMKFLNFVIFFVQNRVRVKFIYKFYFFVIFYYFYFYY